MRVGIVGGGVIGLSIAFELSSRDVEVIVIDRNVIGGGTSWTAAGILPPANFGLASDPIDRLRGFSHSMYPKWVAELQEISGVDIELVRCGGWYLADSVGERASMAGMTQYWKELEIACETRSPQEAVAAEPTLRSWINNTPDAAAWFVEDEYQVRPPRLLKALRIACERQNVTVDEHSLVKEWHESAESVSLRIENQDGERIDTFDHIVIASGVWSGLIAKEIHLEHSLIPIRGQMLLLKTPTPVVKSIINIGNRYMIARRDGHTLVGSCEEEVGFDGGTTPSTIDGLQKFAVQLSPELRDLKPVRSWSGLRPMTFDGFPMIGPVPNYPRTFVAAGHYRSGIHLAPGTASGIADFITKVKPVIDFDAFRVGKQQIHR